MRKSLLATLAVVALVSGCASGPRTPQWQLDARGASDRFVSAYFDGNSRVEALEFARARSETASTGQVDQVARVELLRCAARAASLVFEPCAGFEPLRQDAAAAERAYADYLAGRLAPQDAALLPPAQRGVAAGAGSAAALKSIADPLSRLVAAGVLMAGGKADPEVIATAVETASAQGWRRPLLAWLLVQAERAEKAGAVEEAQRVRRRIDLVGGAKP